MRPLRNAAVQSALAGLLAAYLKLTLKTIRWRVEGQEIVEGVWERGGGVLAWFWHARIALPPACWLRVRAH